MERLSNKVAIVTGASRGIGAAIARRFAAEGARVVVNYHRSVEAAEKLVREIGDRAIAVKADLSNPAEIGPLFDATLSAFGRLDILVNNAAVAEMGTPVERVTVEYYRKHFDLNVLGLLLASGRAAKIMMAAGKGGGNGGGKGGRIINISSGIVRARAPRCACYAGSKAAIEAITRSQAAELGSKQITVNCIAPGLVDTDMLNNAMPSEVIATLVKQTPLGRLGTPQDIADVVAFIASDDARWITGEVIAVNGGLG